MDWVWDDDHGSQGEENIEHLNTKSIEKLVKVNSAKIWVRTWFHGHF